MLSDGKFFIVIVVALICIKGLIRDVNETQEIILFKCFVKCCNRISVSQPSCRHLSPATPLASTLGETSSASQVLSKGSIVRVFLVECHSGIFPSRASTVLQSPEPRSPKIFK
jgi:hypothetical protein